MTNTQNGGYPHLLPCLVTFTECVLTLAANEISFSAEDKALVVSDALGVMNDEIRAAVRHHKPGLLRLAGQRVECARLFGLIEWLRCRSPQKKTRQEAFASVHVAIDAFARLCDLPRGYNDPLDIFAQEAVVMLREEYAELTAPGNPYPLGPLGEDPEAQGRRWNGRRI